MTGFIKKTILLWLCCAPPLTAQVLIDLDNVSRQPLPLILIPFQVREGDARVGRDFNQSLIDYLEIAEQFRLIPPQSLLKDISSEGMQPREIDFGQYKLLNAVVLVKGWGTIRSERISGELVAYDVNAQQILLQMSLNAPVSDLQRVARNFVDELLLKLTGERGIFDTRIAFISKRSGRKELYVMNFDGSDMKQITNYQNLVASPNWSPDGEQLVFVGYPKNPRKETPQLYWVTPGAEMIHALRKVPGNVIAPTFGKTKDWLLATLSFEGDQEIYRIDVKSAKLDRLTFSPGTDVSATLSPDGASMAFASDRTGTPQIWVQPLDGSTKARRLSFEGSYNTSPDWSPHGNNIAYTSRTEDAKFNIFATRPDGVVTSQLTWNEGHNENPSWSPDGRRLVFASRRFGSRHYHIYTMTVDGKKIKQLTFGNYDDTMPVWSPRRSRNESGKTK